MNLGTISSIVAIVTGILGILSTITKTGRNILRSIWHRVSRYKPLIPRDTIRTIPNHREQFWTNASVGGEPAMQVISSCFVTNVLDHQDVIILNSHIKKPYTKGDVSPRAPIPPKSTVVLNLIFFVKPKTRKPGESFQSVIVLTDQFGNEHKTKKVRFEYLGPRPQHQTLKPFEEKIYSITDPVERQAVAVLKDELVEYRQHGRISGELGTIEALYKGKTRTRWIPMFERSSQWIVVDAKEASVRSRNSDALMTIYNPLFHDEKSKFIDALLKRLSRDTEYASVGYLITLVLFRTGSLRAALEKAKNDLMGDSVNGFSNVLMILDGLLAYEHRSFTDENLDEVDRFLDGIKESTFHVKERLTAIRVARLRSA